MNFFISVLVFALALAIPARASAGEEAEKIDTAAFSRQWLLLGHYKKTWLGGYRSELDGAGFFFSSKGKTDPKAELEATIEAMKEGGRTVGQHGLHPQCAFPVRKAFIEKELKLVLPKTSCSKLDDFLASFAAKSVTIAFSSALPNNPGSMFGHTFLRFNRADESSGQKLLDRGVNYAAVVADEESGLKFMLFGLFGGYRGRFSSLPYYEKINEYSRSENRDVWEYDLALSERETQTLLEHIWELETNSYFDYYFFDENCSYQILRAIEVAKPEWSLASNGLYVIPSNTLRALKKIQGAVKSIRFRPSVRRQLISVFDRLNRDEVKEVRRATRGADFSASFTSVKTLDAAVLFLAYEKQKKRHDWSDVDQARYLRVLNARSRLGKTFPEEYTPKDEASRPDLGHETYRVGAGYGALSEWGRFEFIHFRTAYHDLLNRDLGYPRFSHIEFPSVSVRRYERDSKFVVDQLNLVSLTSLSPVNAVETPISWRLNVDVRSVKDFGCRACTVARFRTGAGFAAWLLSENALVYSLLSAAFEAGRGLSGPLRFGPEVESGALIAAFGHYKLQAFTSTQTDLFQSYRPKHFQHYELNQSVTLGDNFELRMLASRSRRANEASVATLFYF